jgi:hypothetical protein
MLSLEWIAGFFDGEGNAGAIITRGSYRSVFGFSIEPRIGISQKTVDILREIQQQLGVGCLCKQRPDHWRLHIQAQDDCLKFIELIVPLSHLKVKQLLLVKEVIETMHGNAKRNVDIGFRRARMMKALELIERLRHLNGDKFAWHKIETARKDVENFDERAYRQRIERSDAGRRDKLRNRFGNGGFSEEHKRRISERLVRAHREHPKIIKRDMKGRIVTVQSISRGQV